MNYLKFLANPVETPGNLMNSNGVVGIANTAHGWGGVKGGNERHACWTSPAPEAHRT